jgi:hypothetical protein
MPEHALSRRKVCLCAEREKGGGGARERGREGGREVHTMHENDPVKEEVICV